MMDTRTATMLATRIALLGGDTVNGLIYTK